MKKFVSILLAALLLFALPALAETVPAAESENAVHIVYGFVLTVDEESNSFTLLQSDGVEIIVHVNEDTVIGFAEDIAAGQFAMVDYDGTSTRSLPAQINAQRVYGETLQGIVVHVDAEAREILLCTESHGHVLARIPEGMDMPTLCEQLLVHFNGVMTMSLPGQINVLAVETIAPEKAR